MVEDGQALAVMGNHELNALAYHTKHPDKPDEYLRPRNEKNTKQHRDTLESFNGHDAELEDALRWFGTLPLWLDRGDLRVIHAAWHEPSLTVLSGELEDGNVLPLAALPAATTKGGKLFTAVETILKGVEVPLPDNLTFRDKDNHLRTEVRIKWWEAEPGMSWRDVALGDSQLTKQLSDDPAQLHQAYTYPAKAPPVFIGHYWRTGTPAPLARNVACLDYSVARKGGSLVAYRWDGERQLLKERFVSVPRADE